MSLGWHLRPASAADREFLLALHRAAMREYVDAVWGWDDAEQERRFDDRFDELCQIIQVDDVDVGQLVVDERPDELLLANIELLPEWQGHGIGTAIVRDLRARAAAARKPLTLRVLRVNARAAQLYEREGLRVVREEPEHLYMSSG
ncbi:MAG TPA: GNAT family N-acetyltransferase [Gaiellaceae bacterium]|nr:GNAT family N-acetyltransferase [Gaiellaceae bacterium]